MLDRRTRNILPNNFLNTLSNVSTYRLEKLSVLRPGRFGFPYRSSSIAGVLFKEIITIFAHYVVEQIWISLERWRV